MGTLRVVDSGYSPDPLGERLAGMYLYITSGLHDREPDLAREDVMRAAAALIRGCDPTTEEWDALFAAVMAPDDDDNDRLPFPFRPEAS